jgi:hypothetical protein
MSIEFVKEICKLQGIEMKIESPVKCHKCETRSLILKPSERVGYCYRCKQSWSFDEIRTINLKQFDYEKRKYSNLMTEKKGVNL